MNTTHIKFIYFDFLYQMKFLLIKYNLQNIFLNLHLRFDYK